MKVSIGTSLAFWFIIGLIFALGAHSQTVETLYPDEDKNTKGDLWTTVVATTGEQTFNFYFNKGRNKGLTNHYSGHNTLCVWVDSTSTSTPAAGDIDITVKPLIFDSEDSRYEPIQDTGQHITVKTAYDWHTGHTDLLLSIFEVLNLGACDGLQVIIGNDDAADIQVRLLLKQSRDK